MKYAAKIAGLALSGLMLVGAGAAQADTNLVTNGGFEINSTEVPDGWLVNALNYGLVIGSYSPSGSAHGGITDVLFQQGGSFATLSQDIATVAGTQYSVSFWLASDGDTPNQMQVSFDGQTLLPASTIAASNWTQYTYTVTAQDAVSTLSFAGQYDKNGALYLDDVSVSAIAAVPEASSYAMLLAGLGMIGFVARRRTRA